VALAAAATGVAVAAIPGPDGVINGCYLNSGGNMRVIDSGKTCDAGETALNWNQTGAPGPVGSPGATGAPGPQGAPGAPGSGGGGTTAMATAIGSEVELVPSGKTDAYSEIRQMTLEPGFYVLTGHVTVIGSPEFTRAPDRGVHRGRRVLVPDIRCQLRLTAPVERAPGETLDDALVHFAASTVLRPEGRRDDGDPVEVSQGHIIGARTSVNFKSRLTLENVATVRVRSRAVVVCQQLTTSPSRRMSRAAARLIAVGVGSIQQPPG